VSASDLSQFKLVIAQVLTPYSSAVLLDPEHALNAIAYRANNVGLLLACESSGYDPMIKERLPRLIDGWSVQRLVEKGANAIKILVYYDPNDKTRINTIKSAFVERVGTEC
jgi:tagatose 1,6-diphosphate aldolase